MIICTYCCIDNADVKHNYINMWTLFSIHMITIDEKHSNTMIVYIVGTCIERGV